MFQTDPFQKLEDFITKIPAVKTEIAKGTYDNGVWWMKFAIDIQHPLAWKVVQELAHVINYLSISERLSTSFYPVAPPNTIDETPGQALAWIIESTSVDFAPNELAEWLEARMPTPVEEAQVWGAVEEETN